MSAISEMAEVGTARCWVCGSGQWRPFKPANLPPAVSSAQFRITDADYGHTGRIDQCVSCGFKQCPDLDSVLRFYEDLDDPAYDEGREQRALQARKILEAVREVKPSGRLLDVGAASGILVEQAGQMGFTAAGIEPSRHLAAEAMRRGLEIHLGTFPHPKVTGLFDVVTLIDVIEHVPTPIGLLRDMASHLAPAGVGVVTTPNVESLVARTLGRRWWHFRVAHIGYFSRRTLLRALDEAGLVPLRIQSPAWYFTWQYAGERALKYMPRPLRFPMPAFTKKLTVRVNFFDSLQVIFRKKHDHE